MILIINYKIAWTFKGRMGCYRPNDYIEDSKAIPKNEVIEAYAVTGYLLNSNQSGAPQNFDYYNVQ